MDAASSLIPPYDANVLNGSALRNFLTPPCPDDAVPRQTVGGRARGVDDGRLRLHDDRTTGGDGRGKFGAQEQRVRVPRRDQTRNTESVPIALPKPALEEVTARRYVRRQIS
jgi:hypothetical protein